MSQHQKHHVLVGSVSNSILHQELEHLFAVVLVAFLVSVIICFLYNETSLFMFIICAIMYVFDKVYIYIKCFQHELSNMSLKVSNMFLPTKQSLESMSGCLDRTVNTGRLSDFIDCVPLVAYPLQL